MLLRHIPRKGDLQTEVELVLSGATGHSGCDQLQLSSAFIPSICD